MNIFLELFILFAGGLILRYFFLRARDEKMNIKEELTDASKATSRGFFAYLFDEFKFFLLISVVLGLGFIIIAVYWK